MAQYVRIPKDMACIKEKFIGGLTKRQSICFIVAALFGFPVYFVVKDYVGITLAIFLMGIVAAPAIVCGLYEKNGLHLEDKVKLIWGFIRSTKIRTYKTENIYEAMDNNMELFKITKKLGGGNKNVSKKESKRTQETKREKTKAQKRKSSQKQKK
jgi:hypothetical protein